MQAAAQLNTDRTIQVGRNALYFENYPLAIQHFNQVIEAKPYLAEPYLYRAIAKYNLQDYSGAKADAARTIEINPFLPDAWEVHGVANQCLNLHAAAAADYARALELLPHNRGLLFNRAIALENAGKPAQADSIYAELIAEYPRLAPARVGRAQLRLARGDTIDARALLDEALALDANSVEALTLRASLAQNPKDALADMERAVTLRPDMTWLRVNRAVARYHAFDFNGTLDDLDYVLELDPLNYTALFNRAMIRTEMQDNDRALLDLDRALQLRPDDVRARICRALVEADKGMFDQAIADADAIVDAYPEMYAGYAVRSHIHDLAGNRRAALTDYRRAQSMEIASSDLSDRSDKSDPSEVAARFRALQTLADESSAQTFNTEGLHAPQRDRRISMEPQPIYRLSYYTAPDVPNLYDRELEELNAARVLPNVVYLTNADASITRDSDYARHCASIARLGNAISAGNARAIDFFARAMDHASLLDYAAATADLDSVISRQPDFAPAYLMRAAVRYSQQEAQQGRVMTDIDPEAYNAAASMTLRQILADLDKALALNPRMAAAEYNRGVLLLRMGRTDDAMQAFTRAIAIAPDLGAAYFNRGYIHFSRGNRDDAVRDLSRAGQLGVANAYALLKNL